MFQLPPNLRLLRRPAHASYFHPLFFQSTPLRGEVIKIYLPPFQKGAGPNYGLSLNIYFFIWMTVPINYSRVYRNIKH